VHGPRSKGTILTSAGVGKSRDHALDAQVDGLTESDFIMAAKIDRLQGESKSQRSVISVRNDLPGRATLITDRCLRLSAIQSQLDSEIFGDLFAVEAAVLDEISLVRDPATISPRHKSQAHCFPGDRIALRTMLLSESSIPMLRRNRSQGDSR